LSRFYDKIDKYYLAFEIVRIVETELPKLLIATENKGKIVEIETLLEGLPFQLVTPESLGLHLNVVEDGQTYAENAARKALAHARASGMLVLADDSGLEVDALGGLPGIRSARFAPQPGASDADRRRYLLQQLQGKPRPWKACFHCTAAVATPEGEIEYAAGECLGEIIPEERGTAGFGYDPVFFLPEYGQTMAELGLEVKNQISHRARAITAARSILARYGG
jgi:XTP/dITP diphosphohydrolase